jgi:predicted small lipoprotein YifL
MNKLKTGCSNFILRLFVALPGLLMLSACGQPGPLYLPSSKPPIYVQPEPIPEPEAKEIDKNSEAKQQPDNKEPAETK